MRLRPKPQIGDRRVVKRFAWLPKMLSNKTRVWLEFYFSVEEYCKGKWIDAAGAPVNGWVEIYSEIVDNGEPLVPDSVRILELEKKFFCKRKE